MFSQRSNNSEHIQQLDSSSRAIWMTLHLKKDFHWYPFFLVYTPFPKIIQLYSRLHTDSGRANWYICIEKFQQIFSLLLLGQYYLTIYEAGLLVSKSVFPVVALVIIFKWVLKIFALFPPLFLLSHFRLLLKELNSINKDTPPQRWGIKISTGFLNEWATMFLCPQ